MIVDIFNRSNAFSERPREEFNEWDRGFGGDRGGFRARFRGGPPHGFRGRGPPGFRGGAPPFGRMRGPPRVSLFIASSISYSKYIYV